MRRSHLMILGCAVATGLAGLAPSWPSVERRADLRCDFSGVRVPEIAAYGDTDNLFTIFYPLYPIGVRAEIRRQMKRRGYTHLVLDPHPSYHGRSPSEDLYPQPERFKAILSELLADDLQPIVMLEASTPITTQTSADEAVRIMRQRLAAWEGDADLMALIRIAATGWEVDDHQSPAAIEALARYFRSILPRDALLFVHFTPGKIAGNAPGESEASWWRRMARGNVLDGLFYQFAAGGGGVEEFRSALADLSAKFRSSRDGFPTRTGRGTPLYLEAFEYSAYFDFKRPEWTEEWARSLGQAAMSVDGVSGFCDGGPAS